MTKLKLLALGVLIATSAGVAHAEGKFSLGAGVGVVEHPYKDYDTDVYPVPVINYEGDNFWFRGLGGGYYPVSYTHLTLPTIASDVYKRQHQMRHLDDRKSTMMAGLSYAHFTQYGYLRTTLAGDTLDNSNGIVWDMAWLYRYTNGGLTVTPGIGVQWNSENQNEYYYGVSRKESARSGLRGYNPNDSWSPYLELSASYNFLGDWSVYGTARYTRLSDEVTDSPMVDKSWTGLISTGITYKF